MSEVQKLKTRYYYTEYVNHMIRFYITCPEVLQVQGKSMVDVKNWCAVQSSFRSLPEPDRDRVIAIYKTHYNLPKAVDLYCERTGEDKTATWVLLTKACSMVAKRRGLI